MPVASDAPQSSKLHAAFIIYRRRSFSSRANTDPISNKLQNNKMDDNKIQANKLHDNQSQDNSLYDAKSKDNE
jgi:hypothetical protein